MKKATIINPFQKEILPFLKPIYDICVELGFRHMENISFPRFLHYALYKFPINFNLSFITSPHEAKVMLISANHTRISIFPHAYNKEIIPVIWDCWPNSRKYIEELFSRSKLKIAFFSARQNIEYFREKYPNIQMLFFPEAINTSLYLKGDDLDKRKIDLLEYGRSNTNVHNELLKINGIKHLYSKQGEQLFSSFSDLAESIANSKVVIAYPRCDTSPKDTGNIETLTQRFWECMYSRTIIVGRAPQELIDLIGYNPVIDANITNIADIIKKVLANCKDYQDLVNRNHEMAKTIGNYTNRLIEFRDILREKGYEL